MVLLQLVPEGMHLIGFEGLFFHNIVEGDDAARVSHGVGLRNSSQGTWTWNSCSRWATSAL